MTELFNLDQQAAPAEQPQELFDLSPDPSIPGVQVASQRAAKYHFGLGQASPGEDKLKYSILAGDEDRQREAAALHEDARLQGVRTDLIREYIKGKPAGYIPRAEDVQFIRDLSNQDVQQVAQNPKVFFEKKYAEKVVTSAFTRGEEPAIDKAMAENPDKAHEIVDKTSKILAQKEVVQHLLEKYEAEYKQLPGVEKGLEIAGMLAPFKQWYRQQNLMKGAPTSSFLLGNNLEEQANHYYQLPLDESKSKLEAAASELARNNVSEAISYLQFMAGYSSSDVFLGNFQSVMDLGTLAPGVGLVPYSRMARAARPTPPPLPANTSLTQTATDVLRATGGRATSVPQVLENSGDLQAAGIELAATRMRDQVIAPGFEGMAGDARAFFVPEQWFANPNFMASEAKQRIQTVLQNNTARLLEDTILKPLNINRLEPGTNAHNVALANTSHLYNVEYPHLNDYILNVRPDHTVIPARPSQALRALVDKSTKEIADKKLTQRHFEFERTTSRLEYIQERLQEISTTVKEGRTGKLGQAMDAAERAALSDELTQLQLETRLHSDALKKFLPAEQKLFNTARDASNKLIEHTKSMEFNSLTWTKGLGNIDYLSVQLGTKEATLYANPDIADTTAKNILGLRDYKIKQLGNGYYIEVYKAVDEKAPSVLNALRVDVDGSTPANRFTNTLGILKSANFNLSKQTYEDRVVATFGSSYMTKVLRDVVNPVFGTRNLKETAKDLIEGIPAWRKDTRKDFSEFIESQRTYKDPNTGRVGRFSSDQAEFERDFNQQFGKMPDARQSLAYGVYVQLSDWDLTIRNMTALKHKSVYGAENFAFPLQGVTYKKPFIEGKLIDAWPGRSADFNPTIVLWDKEPGKIQVMTRNFKSEKELNKYLEDGYKLVHLSNDGSRDLQGYLPPALLGKAADKNVRFVLTKEFESSPLSIRQLPDRPGGHIEYDVNHYVRQPDIQVANSGKLIYNGDKNMFGFMQGPRAKLIADRVEVARKMLRDVRDRGAPEGPVKAYVEKNLPFTIGAFKREFDPTKNGIFSLDHPFMVTGPGENTWKLHNLNDDFKYPQYKGIKNAKDDPFNLYKGSDFLEFSQERGDTLKSVAIEGSKRNPTYKLTEAPMLDSFSTMRRAADNLMSGRYMEDLKVKAADRFIAEFGNLLDARGGIAEMQSNPMRYIFNTPWKTPSANTDYDKLAAAKNYLRSLKEFLNLRSDADKTAAWMNQKAADWILGDKKVPLVRDHLIPTLTDPIQKMKNLAFNVKIISPKQLIVQWSQAATLAGVEGPVATMKAVPALVYTKAITMGGMDDAMILEASKHMSKLGWKGPDFIEAYRALQRTGFANVGRETAMLDDFMAPPLTRGPWGLMHDAGKWFFNKGEQGPRILSWYAVYSKWRDANPAAKLTDDVVKQLLVKAQDGTGHMSSAAMAGWQKGSMEPAGYATGVISKAPSLAGQFSAVNAKIFEMMASGNPEVAGYLTAKERARLMTVYSTLFGIPMAAGVYAFGYPLAKEVKKWMAEEGVVAEDSAALNIAMNGAPAVLMGWVNGGDQPNFGERYGPGALSFIQDATTGDRRPWEILLGASGSVFKDVFTASHPIAMAVAGIFKNSPGTETYKLKSEDVGNFLSSISATADDARKMWYAINFGMYMNKAGLEVDKFNKTNLALMELVGMRPEDVTRYYSKVSNMADLKKLQEAELKNVEKNFVAALSALEQGDDKGALDYFTRAKLHAVAGGWRDDQGALLLSRITRNLGSRLEAAGRKYAMGSPEKLQAWIRELERRGR